MLEETGVLRVKTKVSVWDETCVLAKECKARKVDVDAAQQLRHRIYLRNRKFDDWWTKSTVSQRMRRPFRTRKIPINESPEMGRRMEILHKSVAGNITKAELLWEYTLILHELNRDLRRLLEDDGGE